MEKREKEGLLPVKERYVATVVMSSCSGEEIAVKIVRDANQCVGCGTCALICSFHHHRVFSLKLSSIKVVTDMVIGKVKWAIDSTCDSCLGESVPLCVKYCAYGALEVWNKGGKEK